jgi:hypothetical protein
MKSIIALGIVGAVLVGIALIIGGMLVSANNYGARTESLLKASKEQNKNVLAQYGQKVLEASQVPGMYTEDFQKLTTAAIQGRYGENGSQAAMQWIKEQNPQLDSKVYTKIQQLIEGGRNDFANSQTRMIDIRRQYETELNSFPSGFFLKLVGYPKVNLADYDIVSTERADTVFKNKKEDGPIKLR